MTTIRQSGIVVMTTATTPTYTAACDSVVSGTKRLLAFASVTRQPHASLQGAQNKIPHQTICNNSANIGLILKILEAA